MIHHRRADFARARDKVDDTRRQPGVLKNLRELQRRNRRGLGGFEHHRVAHRERRREFPGAHQQREIPRGHLPDDPKRRDLPARRDVVEFVRPTGVVEKMRRRHGHVEVARFLDGLAAVERLRDGKLARAILQKPRDTVEIFGAFAAGHLAPDAIVGALRRGISGIDIGRTRERDLRELLLVGRINGVEILTALWGNELSVDKQLVARLQFRIRRLGRRIKLPKVAKNQLGRGAARTNGGAVGFFGGGQSGHFIFNRESRE